MNFDFGFDREEDSMFDFNRMLSKSGKKGEPTLKRKKRTFGNAFKNQNSTCSKSTRENTSASSIASNRCSSQSSRRLPAGASIDINSSFSSSSPSTSQTGTMKSRVPSISIDKSSRHCRRSIRRRQEEDEYYINDDDELPSAHSNVSSSCDASVASTATGDSIAIARPYATSMTSQLSVRRGAGSSAYAVQDAGTYQMIRDECSYLCSTILSKRTRPAKAIDAAIELATLLSSRKTRSMLWQGGTHDRYDDDFVIDDNRRKRSSSRNGCRDPQLPSSSSERSNKLSPIPKVWSSILEVLAVAATTGGSFDNCSSSNSSISTTSTVGSVRVPAGIPPTKYRTKSARRKEKELLQSGGCIIGTTTHTSGTANIHHSILSKGSELNPNLKDVLACIFYFVSWDCTMSGEHSIAAMGAVKSSAVARKIRLAILERGAVLNGMLRLMAPSQQPPAVATTDSSRQAPFHSTFFSTTTEITGPPVSPLRTSASPIPKRPLRSSIVPDSQHNVNGISSSTRRVKTSLSSKIAGDPTAMGRRKRKHRRKLHNPLQIMDTDYIPQQAEGLVETDKCKTMPPPSNRSVASLRRKVHRGDELSFTDASVQNQPARNSRRGCETNDDGSSIISDASMGGTSILKGHLVQNLDSLRAKVHIESSLRSRSLDIAKVPSGNGADSRESIIFQRNFLTKNGIVLEGDRPWLSIVCLESLTRIITGKDLNGKTSCLVEEDTSRSNKGGRANDDDIDIDDENNNVVMVTNRLVGKSGMIPLLSCAMSQSMAVSTKLVFIGSCRKGVNTNANESSNDADEDYLNYCFNRLNLLASLIDEACFFSERNRRSFCEVDPFSFQDRKKGLIFHILIFLQQCSRCNLNQLDHKRSEIMSLALRTLTSLTHNNRLAAEQMKIVNDRDADFNNAWDAEKNVQGIRILANLVFQLEESPPIKSRRAESTCLKRVSDHNMHRYDGTIFCLTTLANVTEGAGICRIMMEMKLVLHSGKFSLWLEWLCQWLVKQTETFRQEILSIGKTKKLKRGSIRTTSTPSEGEDGELQQDEEEKLIAAGNGCVVLACLITESDDGDPDSSISIRNLIKKQMPFNSDGSSSGLSLVVNTLKAYCNYYQMSMGEMSVAVVSPVRKLITELEEIALVDEHQPSQACDELKTQQYN